MLTDPSAQGFIRSYNSQNTAAVSTLGTAWRHGYDRSILVNRASDGTSGILAARANGTAYAFRAIGSAYTSQDTDINDRLFRLTNDGGAHVGWRYTVAADNSIETYDAAGRLMSIVKRAGLVQALTYSDATTPVSIAPKAGLLIRVTDSFGRQLNFTYDSASRIATMSDPSNGSYIYTYDTANNLTLVTYPDHKTKAYRYDEPAYTGGTNLPHALTGIFDENNVRFATYYYNAEGKAYKEHHGSGVNQYQIDYGSNGGSSTITDPLGTARTTHFTTILGVIKATGQSQPGGSGCGPASSAINYDANGNVASRTDFNGSKTCHAYDLTRNLETAPIEGLPATADCAAVLSAASLAAPARRISTSWHPTYRLPMRVAEPLHLTINTYDANGNLESKTVQATFDATGAQGHAATVTGTPRIWRYTYNQYGQVLTATGPRTDIEDKTTYTYDSTSGNLMSVTNAAGHVTTLSNYDANGRVGRIVDANGLTTDMTYWPRGWLKSRAVTGNGVTEATTYDYDGVGQLKKVTMPDGSWIGYDYDDAHRLTDTYDRLGNRISYTLDAMGNRISEQVTDPTGALARQTSRVYDALNRLQTVTGAVQ